MVTLAEKVRFLADPGSYPEAPGKVEPRETHMSWVFLADTHVYKLKKPVKRPFLDFSTLKARKFFCEEELRLNRRLAADTYRAVRPLYCDRDGRLSFGPGGRVVDWLVVMLRLPRESMLDAHVKSGRVEAGDVVVVAERLAEFYAGCPPEIVDGPAYIDHLLNEHEISRTILLRREFGFAETGIAALLDEFSDSLRAMLGTIETRIAKGRIVEGHGDLRPEHVCMAIPPQIIDCLEFNRAMRIIDPYDEVNYLGLECEILGAPWIRPLLLDALDERLGGRPDERLLALYSSFRAFLRARLCLVHLLEHPVRHPEKWQPLAIQYLTIAERECASLRRPEDRKSIRPRAAG